MQLSLFAFNCCLILKGNLRNEFCKKKQYLFKQTQSKFLHKFFENSEVNESKNSIETGQNTSPINKNCVRSGAVFVLNTEQVKSRIRNVLVHICFRLYSQDHILSNF